MLLGRDLKSQHADTMMTIGQLMRLLSKSSGWHCKLDSKTQSQTLKYYSLLNFSEKQRVSGVVILPSEHVRSPARRPRRRCHSISKKKRWAKKRKVPAALVRPLV